MAGNSSPTAASAETRTSSTIRPRVVLEALAVWVVLLVVAILNAGFRETVVAPRVSEYVAHVVGTVVTGVPAFLLVMYLYFRYTNLDHAKRELELVGFLWVALTVSFEFLFGHYVMGTSWDRLLHDYNVFAGRVWVLVLLSLLVGPLLFGHYLGDE